MSKQIDKLIKKFPNIIQDVSYEGSDGIWLYMHPGWYCSSSDCGTIHEYTVKQCLECFRDREWNPERWIEENPDDTVEIVNIRVGKYN